MPDAIGWDLTAAPRTPAAMKCSPSPQITGPGPRSMSAEPGTGLGGRGVVPRSATLAQGFQVGRLRGDPGGALRRRTGGPLRLDTELRATVSQSVRDYARSLPRRRLRTQLPPTPPTIGPGDPSLQPGDVERDALRRWRLSPRNVGRVPRGHRPRQVARPHDAQLH